MDKRHQLLIAAKKQLERSFYDEGVSDAAMALAWKKIQAVPPSQLQAPNALTLLAEAIEQSKSEALETMGAATVEPREFDSVREGTKKRIRYDNTDFQIGQLYHRSNKRNVIVFNVTDEVVILADVVTGQTTSFALSTAALLRKAGWLQPATAESLICQTA